MSMGDIICQFTVPGRPVPKARPRWAPRGNTYTAPRTAQAEERIGQYLKVAYPALRPAEGRLGLSVEVYIHGGRQGDADNYLKLVADALNRKAWLDDKQLDRMYVEVFRDSPSSMTCIKVYELE